MAGRRPWGWHALEPGWAEDLVDAASLPPGALVLDVGAGTGAITGPLVSRGARVIAVEAHPERAAALRARFGRSIVVVEADAADLRLPRRPYYVVANPPFGVTAPLLRRLLQPGSRLARAHLVLQESAARRWAHPGAPGAGRWRLQFAATAGPRLPRAAFRPPPRVDVRVLTIERLGGPGRTGR
ncbi:MAG TPA: rRNA adenine N(6)-methyltransferase family protein [Acidimicrobiales bacterium]|nr:rRNA adenine N(6)-methyltransferase family protein [Acidimicrobiales bacterium]